MSLLPIGTVEKLHKMLNPASPDDIRTLRDIAGIDPTEDLRYCNFCQCDFQDMDVTGWDFSGTILIGADLSQVTNITKAIFDRDSDLTDTKLPPGITVAQLLSR